MTPVHLAYTLTLDEVAEGIAPVLRRRVILIRLLLVAAILGISAVVWLNLRHGESWIENIPWLPVPIVFTFLIYRSRNFTRNAYKKVYEQSVTMKSETLADLSDAGVEIKSYFVSSASKWERFTHWKETKHLIILYEGRIAVMFPKRAMSGPSEIEAVRVGCREFVRHQVYRAPVPAFPIETVRPT